MSFTLVNSEASIVLVGAFNPAIFQPQWLAMNSIIQADEADNAEIEFIHNDISKFSLSWLSFEVLQNKITVRTNDTSYFLPLRDLVISIFSILNQTPITQLGMNKNMEFSMESEDLWHKVGDTLAPKAVWAKSLPERVGLLTLRVKSPRVDQLPGHISAAVEPINSIRYGIKVSVNSHVDLQDDDCPSLDKVLLEGWEESLNMADAISQETINGAVENG